MSFNLKRYLEKTAGDAEITEKQLHGQSDADKTPTTTTQDQLEKVRGKEATNLTEDQLNKVRSKDGKKETKANSNPKLNKQSAKDDAQITEKQLDHSDKEPGTVTEDQLEDARVNDEFESTIEARLKKVRVEAASLTLVEEQLNSSKSKLVKHRNPEASAGDFNLLDQQRVAKKKKEEKAKLASETPKDAILETTTPGDDGLRLANNSAQKKTP